MSKFLTNDNFLTKNVDNISLTGLESIKDYVFSILMNSSNKIKSHYIDTVKIVDVFQVADETERLALSVVEGDIAIQTDDGSVWIYGDSDTWIQMVYPRLLSMLTDVVINSPTDYHYLYYHTDSNTWRNRIMQLSACNDIYFPSLPNDNEFLRHVGGVWRSVAVDLKTNINSLDDVVITSPINGNLLSYNGTNWINSVSPFQIYDDHINDLSIHREIAEPTAGYIPIGNGTVFNTSLLEMSLLDDCNISTKHEGHILRVNSSGNFINTFADKIITVASSRLLNINDEGATLYSTQELITLIMPVDLEYENASTIKIRSSGQIILRCNEGVLINGRFDEIRASNIDLIKIADNDFYVKYEKDESKYYKTLVSTPALSDLVNRTKSIEHTSINMSNIIISYSSQSTTNRIYLNFNIDTNTIVSTTSVTGYNGSFSDILNINNSTLYTFQCNASEMVCVYSSNNYSTKTVASVLGSGVDLLSNSIFYDSIDGMIIIPYINNFDKFYICRMSLDLLTIQTKDCNTVLANATKLIAGYHFGRSVMMCENNTNYVKLLIDKTSNMGFMNDATAVSIDFQLAVNEHIMEMRRTEKSDRFYFMTQDISHFNIHVINDVFDGVMKMFSIPAYSEIFYSPCMIRDDIASIPMNTQYAGNVFVCGMLKINLSDFDVKRDINIFNTIHGENFFGFLVRRNYGFSAMGLPYENTGAMRYKNII